jgi:hypothetical protein
VFLVYIAFKMQFKYVKITFTPNFDFYSRILVDKLFCKVDVLLNPNFLSFRPEGEAYN